MKKALHKTARGVTVGALPSPVTFGAPPKFTSWRREQEEAAVLLDQSRKQASFLQLPTGTGKSLTAFMYSRMHNLTGPNIRTLILTETRALQQLYETDFSSHGLVSISGARNYPCPALRSGGQYQHFAKPNSRRMCDEGPCRVGLPCELKEGGCPFYDQVRKVEKASVVTTSYANRMSVSRMVQRDRHTNTGDALGEFQIVILDEAHAAPDAVTRGLTIELPLHELRQYFGRDKIPPVPTQTDRATRKLLGRGDPGSTDTLAGWSIWLAHVIALQVVAHQNATEELKAARTGGQMQRELIEDIRYLRRLGNDLSMLSKEENGKDWVAEVVKLGGGKEFARFQPVWPRAYCEDYLFRGAQKIVGMSATIHPYAVEQLGIKHYDFWEFDSPFPVENRPVYYWPVAFMRWDMPESEKRRWVHANDQIAKHHRGEKGIVHTGSYDRANYFKTHSKLPPSRVKTHTSWTTQQVVQEFIASTSDDVLVSPSVGTGWSFDDDAARFQSIVKLAFPDRRSKLIERRCREDRRYPLSLVMDTVVQAAGRIIRSTKDWGSTYITDKLWKGFYEKNSQFAPKWFRGAIQTISRLPR